MVKISDFSRLSQVTVKALRHYDEMGIFKPAQIDRFTGYRYYTVDQLPQLKRILALKEMGLSLEQIRQILSEEISQEQMVGMLRLKQAELRQQVRLEQGRLARVEAWLRQFEQERIMYEVKVKSTPAIWAASMKDVVPDPSQYGRVFDRLFGMVKQHITAHRETADFAGPPIALYLDDEYREQDIHVEAACPVVGQLPETHEIKVQQLPEVAEMAYVEHQGPFDGLRGAFDALLHWIEANNYTINGPGREVYVQFHRENNPADWITEVQFPVVKR